MWPNRLRSEWYDSWLCLKSERDRLLDAAVRGFDPTTISNELTTPLWRYLPVELGLNEFDPDKLTRI